MYSNQAPKLSLAMRLHAAQLAPDFYDRSRGRAYQARLTCPLWLRSAQNEVTSRPLSEPGKNSGGQFIAIDACHLPELALGPCA